MFLTFQDKTLRGIAVWVIKTMKQNSINGGRINISLRTVMDVHVTHSENWKILM